VDERRAFSRQRLVFGFGRGRGGDVMRLEERGNPWVVVGILLPRHADENADAPTGVCVIGPGGDLLGHTPISEDLCTNLAFGGPDGNTLDVTSGKTIHQAPLAVSGYALYAPAVG
jgi:sugar lactone lactonase YvrE